MDLIEGPISRSSRSWGNHFKSSAEKDLIACVALDYAGGQFLNPCSILYHA